MPNTDTNLKLNNQAIMAAIIASGSDEDHSDAIIRALKAALPHITTNADAEITRLRALLTANGINPDA